jgi:hypothetical protein
MVTTAVAIRLAVLPTERGGYAGAGGLKAAQHLVAGFFQQSGAGQCSVQIKRESGAVVLHDGEFFLDIGGGEVILDPRSDGALKLVEGGGKTRQRRRIRFSRLGLIAHD